jgi:choline kinase
MVQIGSKPILGHVWDALSSIGVDELVVIRGYRGDVLETFIRSNITTNVTFVDNTEWETNNVLLSMGKARPFFDRPTYVTYSDIVFTPAVAEACATSTAEVGLVIDRRFRDIYVGRTDHPLDEGEVSDLLPDGTVARVGKKALPPADAVGEYIGLCRLGTRGAAIVGNTLDSLAQKFVGREEEPFQRAARYRNAYQTDLWQQLIDTGIQVDPIFIDGQWREIDTGQDLARARELLESRPKEWT